MERLEREEAEREEREMRARAEAFAKWAAGEEAMDWSDAEGDDAALHDSEDEVASEDEDQDDGYAAAVKAAAAEAAEEEAGGVAAALAVAEAAAAAGAGTWEASHGFVRPGHAGFTLFARARMAEADVPSNRRVLPPEELRPPTWMEGPGVKPLLQPYQETVSFLVRPAAYSNPHMLVVHRTGAGKTATMVSVADNFFNDLRPKILIFPTAAVCRNFYSELREAKFPNRYRMNPPPRLVSN